MYLGIDCGTQGTKALLIDRDGLAHGRGYAPHALIERTSGAREQDPLWWVEALRTAVRQAAPAGTDLRALGVSGQQHGLVILDEDKQVIRPAKLWNDTETAPQNQQLIDLFGGKQAWFQRFGIVPLTGYTVSKLLWLKQQEPEHFARIRHILLPHEYLNFYLTGQLRAEFGDASGTGFFDPRSRHWIPEVLDAIDGGTGQLRAALPPLGPVVTAVGTLLPAVAHDLGLPATAIVSAGGGDNMMGAIGTANVRPGVVTLSLGTSSTVYSYQSQPAGDPTGNVAPFCSSSGGWLPLVCTMNATNVVTQTLETLGRTVADIDPALAATQPGAGGLVFLPFLNGERTPDLPTARGTLTGLSGTNWTPENLIRAAIEGVTFGVLNGLELMQQGRPVQRILVIGGGSRSTAWRQLIADTTGATVEVPVETEAGCLGAAIQALYLDQAGRESFADITQRCVKGDPTRSNTPNSTLAPAYRQALTALQPRSDTPIPLSGVPHVVRSFIATTWANPSTRVPLCPSGAPSVTAPSGRGWTLTASPAASSRSGPPLDPPHLARPPHPAALGHARRRHHRRPRRARRPALTFAAALHGLIAEPGIAAQGRRRVAEKTTAILSAKTRCPKNGSTSRWIDFESNPNRMKILESR